MNIPVEILTYLPNGVWEMIEFFGFIIGIALCIRAWRWAMAPIENNKDKSHNKDNK